MKFVTLDIMEKMVKAIASKVAPKSHTHGNDDITGLDASKLTGTVAAARMPEEVTDSLLRSAYSNGLLSDALLVDTIDTNGKTNMPHILSSASQNKPDDMGWGIREIVWSSKGYLVARITGVDANGSGAIWTRSYNTAWEPSWHKSVTAYSQPVFAGVLVGPSDLATDQCNFIYPDGANGNRLTFRYRKADGALVYRSMEALVNAAEGNHTHDNRYYTETEVTNLLAQKMPVTGGTFTGAVGFRNETWNPVGDDCAFGDANIGGCVAFKSMSSGAATGIALVGKSSNAYGRLLINDYGGDMYMAINGGLYVSTGDNSARAPIFASAFNNSSSRRVKKNIEYMTEDEAKKLLSVEVKSYDYINPNMPDGCFGCIAEDVAKIIPYCVNGDVDCADDDTEAIRGIGIDYSKLVPHLIKMVQIQQRQIDNLTAQVSKLQNS